MDTEKSLVKITNKYLCMVSGKKLMEPCEGCDNPNGCLSRAMQYKETEEMDSMDQDFDIEIVDSSDDSIEEKAFGAPMPVRGGKPDMDEEQMEGEDEDEEDMDDDEEVDEEEMKGKGKKKMSMPEEEMVEDDMDEEDMEDGKGYGMMKPGKRSRRMAMKSLGVDTDDDNVFLCQLERKVYPSTSEVCANCPGGCASEEGMPGILDVEGMVLGMFGGKVLSSGYADEADLFIVDVMGKDGRAFEVLADGQNGEIINFHRLNTTDLESGMGVKSLEDATESLIDIKTAERIALEMLADELGIQGKVLEADSDIFEGFDAYVFEIDAENGKSYDAYVGLGGERFGYDEYDASEVLDIEAEAAELALKRMYSEDEREKMSESGMALPDGSFPIKDVEDLKNAIQAYGRAKDKGKAKAHIMKRALDLDAEDLIPENWVPKKVAEAAAMSEDDGEKSAEDAEFIKSLMEFEMLTVEEDI